MTNLPSTRFYASCLDALKDQTNFSSMTEEQKQQFNQDLQKLPIDDDELRLFLKRNLGMETFDKILIKTEQIINEKNLREVQSTSAPLRIENHIPNAEYLWHKQPYFYDKARIWWTWNVDHWEITDDTDMSRLLDNQLGFCGQTVTSYMRSSYLEAMRWVGRARMPKEAPKKWIQFKDKAFSIKSKKIYKVQPNYFFCNPIPWEMGETEDTPVMDKLFTEWVGEKHKQVLYEIVAYCCYTDYPIQVLFCLYGIGCNGKTAFLRLLACFLGQYNIGHTELDLLTGHNRSRFEASKIFKKLVCQMGETNFGLIQHSSTLKQLTGGDLLSFEMKNKDPFMGYNYAKLVIASNSLPVSADTSDGWYRRWIIVDFSNTFPEGKDILESIPKEEYNNLAKKVTRILPELLERGCFCMQGDLRERKRHYTMASNPLPVFLERYTDRLIEGYTKYSTLYTAYAKYLKLIKRRIISIREFGELLAGEGIEISKTSKILNGIWISDRWVEMVELNPQKVEKMSDEEMKSSTDRTDHDVMTRVVPYPLYRGLSADQIITSCDVIESNTQDSTGIPIEEDVAGSHHIYLKCYLCGAAVSGLFDDSPGGKGRPICGDCSTAKDMMK